MARIIRIFIYTIIICFFFMLLSSIQFDRKFVEKWTKQKYKFNQVIENGNSDEFELKTIKIVKIGGDSVNLKTDKNYFQQNLGTCQIPNLEMNGSEVYKFYKKFPQLECQEGQPLPLVYIDEERRIQATKITKEIGLDEINCQWTFYSRINDQKIKWSKKAEFNFGDKIEGGDFFKVTCKFDNNSVWSNPFMVAVPDKERVENLQQIRENKTKEQQLNVYILSFDSLSQMSFRRNLPKTVKFLQEKKSIIFNGYNIVGDGTPQAFIPTFTGKTEEELPLTRKRYKEANYVDDVYPFIWTNYSKKGYANLYGEDGHELGTFTYRLKGFRKTPTDHFPITFFQYTEQMKRPRQCIGPEKQHVVWFRYIESFWREYKQIGLPRFSVMHHSCLSHDDMNRVQQADEDLVLHLQKMEELGAYEDSLFIVMADHGARFSELRQTQQGQLEERLPFISINFPISNDDEGYKIVHANLLKNALNRLATPFDLHATLLDVLNWPLSINELQKPNQYSSSNAKSTFQRAFSLFREIPLNRTCDQAGIEAHWCTCLNWQKLENTNEAKILAKAVVKLINDYLESEKTICSPLKLVKIINAKKLVPNENLLKYNGVLDKDGFVPQLSGKTQASFATYQILFETSPGNAKYEVTLFYDGKQITVDWNAISHINKYGDNPHCIIKKNYFMASFCVCYDRI